MRVKRLSPNIFHVLYVLCTFESVKTISVGSEDCCLMSRSCDLMMDLERTSSSSVLPSSILLRAIAASLSVKT